MKTYRFLDNSVLHSGKVRHCHAWEFQGLPRLVPSTQMPVARRSLADQVWVQFFSQIGDWVLRHLQLLKDFRRAR